MRFVLSDRAIEENIRALEKAAGMVRSAILAANPRRVDKHVWVEGRL